MIEPLLAVQKAIRAHLIPNQGVAVLVPADHIRAGTTRPDKLPAIIIADGASEFLGHASGGQYVARVVLDLHVWAIEDGLDRAKTIGGAVADALRKWPAGIGFAFDEWKHVRTFWPRDPDPNMGHGVLSVEAVIRWKQ